jgi:signal peptidase II
MAERRFGFTIAFIVFILDQLTKWIVTGPLGIRQLGDQLYVLPIFNLTFTENRGISLGLLTASSDLARWLLVALTAAIAAGVAVWIGREKERGDQLALGLVLGGALGNILDRARFGYVVDFADLHFTFWPQAMCWSYSEGSCRPFLIFNVADAAISIGVATLLVRAFLSRKDADAPEEYQDHA